MQTIREEKLKEKIGLNIFRLRRKHDLSLDAVAKLTKMKIGKLDGIERGHGCMNIINLERLSKFYKVDISELFK